MRHQVGKYLLQKKNSSEKNDCPMINVAFMGAASTGKSCIVHRIVGKRFQEEYKPTVFDYYDYRTKESFGLQIADTAGGYEFPAMDRVTIQKADVIVIVFDLTSAESFRKAVSIIKDIKQEHPQKGVVVVGNKMDLCCRIATKHELENHVTCNLQLTYTEFSAKREANTNELLTLIFEEYEISNGPYDIQRSKKPLQSKLIKRLSKSTANLLDMF